MAGKVGERIAELAIHLLRQHQFGLRFSGLVARILEADPSLDVNMVRSTVRALDKKRPDKVRIIGGLYRSWDLIVEQYWRIAEAGRTLVPSPDTPGQARIKAEHERQLRGRHGEGWLERNADFLRAEWEYLKHMFLDTPDAVRDHLRYLGQDPRP